MDIAKGQIPIEGIYLGTILTEVHRKIIGKDWKIRCPWSIRTQENIDSALWVWLIFRKSCHQKCREGWMNNVSKSQWCFELLTLKWDLCLKSRRAGPVKGSWQCCCQIWGCDSAQCLLSLPLLALAPVSSHSGPALRTKLAGNYSVYM